MHIDCLGASREVGRSAFLLETDKKIMLDYGIKLFDESGKATFPLPGLKPDLMVLSHAHMDHSGCLPMLYKDSKIRWYATPPTKDICELLWMDSMKIMGENLPYKLSHFSRALKYWTPIMYNQPIKTGETQIEFHDAGHIAGSAMVEIEYQDKSVVYSGDFKCEDSYMHTGAKTISGVDVLMIETTYAKKEHPPRDETEKKFMDDIEETLENGGNVLLPAFALGRTQELIAMIRKHNKNIPVFVDGMGKTITETYLHYPKYIRDAETFRKATKSVTMVQGIPDKKAATRDPSVIISTAGMMNGGPVLNYLFNLNSESKVIFTGYCVDGTNGAHLQREGFIIKDEEQLQIDLPVEYYDFSAHAGRTDLLNFIKKANPEKVVLIHGDKPEEFAIELAQDFGFDAIAPLPGERIMLD